MGVEIGLEFGGGRARGVVSLPDPCVVVWMLQLPEIERLEMGLRGLLHELEDKTGANSFANTSLQAVEPVSSSEVRYTHTR